jgi:hypothetical protein
VKTREELLREIADLGVNPKKPVRKRRADAGMPRASYKERSDKGQPRGSYINTAAKYKNIYERMLKGHAIDSSDEGADTLTRDNNGIFPPNLNHFYKITRYKDREYVNSVLKPAHIEQARWRWMLAEENENPLTRKQWRERIAKWYFIKSEEIEQWTYTEWAWAYVNHIGGSENRLIANPVILSYDDYLSGQYNGRAQFDAKGEIIWTK